MTISNKKLAIIHILKKELNLTEDQYRNTLERIAGVRSAKDLSDDKFQKLMHYFVRSQHYQINNEGLTIKQRLYIEYEFSLLNWNKNHIENFIRKYYHHENIMQLSKKEATKLIVTLKNISSSKNKENLS
ncbi:MAG: hypothetical protein A2Y40_00710 [Candidatus Margulisbacteria bacterium GWF2_35_9]|nr:MAG: hypothetical protein A2Y40_00710 [Candidatus Margulisbacteria bacterium GWF2_35_9]